MKAPVSNKTGNASTSKMNANSNQQAGLSATTVTTSNTYDHKTFIKILYGGISYYILSRCLNFLSIFT